MVICYDIMRALAKPHDDDHDDDDDPSSMMMMMMMVKDSIYTHTKAEAAMVVNASIVGLSQ